MLRKCACVVIAHMVDATQLCVCCNCTHAGCYATVLVLSLHTCLSLCLSCLVTGQIGPKSKQCYKIEKKTSFFRRRLLIRTFFFEDTNPWKKWDEINIWTNKPYMEFNTLAAFRASSTKCHVNIAQGRNHGRNLVFESANLQGVAVQIVFLALPVSMASLTLFYLVPSCYTTLVRR